MSDKDSDAEESAKYTEEDLLLFGCRLAEHRRARGWTQRQASRRARMDATRLSRIERGTVWPRLAELVALGRVYGLGLDQLVFGPAGTEGGEGEEESLIRQIREAAASATAGDRAALVRFVRAALNGFRVG